MKYSNILNILDFVKKIKIKIKIIIYFRFNEAKLNF